MREQGCVSTHHTLSASTRTAVRLLRSGPRGCRALEWGAASEEREAPRVDTCASNPVVDMYASATGGDSRPQYMSRRWFQSLSLQNPNPT